MNIHEITSAAGKHEQRDRVGRGPGSGNGKTSGRGHGGAHSRSGWKRRYYFEGGQMPLVRRIGKRGFTNAPFRKQYDIVNLATLERIFAEGDSVDLAGLVARGVLKSRHDRLKVLGEGDLTKKLDLRVAKISVSARAKVEAAGGTVTVIESASSESASSELAATESPASE